MVTQGRTYAEPPPEAIREPGPAKDCWVVCAECAHLSGGCGNRPLMGPMTLQRAEEYIRGKGGPDKFILLKQAAWTRG